MSDLRKKLDAKIERLAHNYMDKLGKGLVFGEDTIMPVTKRMMLSHKEGAHAMVEQLVKATSVLKELRNEAKGLKSAHEIVIRQDAGNTNIECLDLKLTQADEALTDLEAWLDEGE